MSKNGLITGSTGLVGSRFVEMFKSKYKLLASSLEKLDLTKRRKVLAFLKENNPDFIINFAAYTVVNEAEKQRGNKKGVCWRANVESVRNLVDLIDSEKTHFIQISTDMVFPGSIDDPGPYSEDHKVVYKPGRLTWYGYTKAEAERLVLERFGNNATIVRIIYPVRAKFEPKLDYLREILNRYDQGNLYPMFSDQQLSISFIDEISQALDKVIESGLVGIYHVSSRDLATPYEIASYLLGKLRKGVIIKKASLKKFLRKIGNASRYPMYGGLKADKTMLTLGMRFSSWRQIIDKVIEQGVS